MASAARATAISEADLRSFTQHLKGSTRILALLGAGLSAGSGLPTFRGAGGLWRSHNATDLATPEAFNAYPGLVWQFYSYRRHMALSAQPNKAHYALAALAKKDPNFMTLTQNVDGMDAFPLENTSYKGVYILTFLVLLGLSERADHPEPQLQRLHGSLFKVQCSEEDCGYYRTNDFQDPIVPALAIPRAFGQLNASAEDKTGEQATNKIYEAMNLNEGDDTARGSNPAGAARHELDISDESVQIPELTEDDLPHCPECKTGLLRPGVVWFGEPLPTDTLGTVEDWVDESKVDLVLVVGTSAQVFPAAAYIDEGRSKGARVAVVNMDPSHLPRSGLEEGDWFFQGDASVILPEILKPVIGDI